MAQRVVGVAFTRYGCGLVQPGAWSLLVVGVVFAGEGRGLAGERPSWASFAERAQWVWIVQLRASRGEVRIRWGLELGCSWKRLGGPGPDCSPLTAAPGHFAQQARCHVDPPCKLWDWPMVVSCNPPPPLAKPKALPFLSFLGVKLLKLRSSTRHSLHPPTN